MGIAKLIKDAEFTRVYESSNGNLITLVLDDCLEDIIFRDEKGKKVGEFEFRELANGGYKLTRMYNEVYKGEGLGRAALEFFKEASRSKLYVSPNDGQTRDDGSHLTEDAPGFAAKMIKEGLFDGYDADSIYVDDATDW